MASLPARRPSQRRASPAEQSQSQAPSAYSHTSPVRSRSEDSQTIFVNRPEEGDEVSAAAPALQSADTNNHEEDVKKCWICFSDSTEDTPDTSPWRDPCPCALVAHEECLLDWIADKEAPNKSSRNSAITAPKIECPQCMSEIKLSRPRDYLVDTVRSLERVGHKAVTPSALTVLSGVLYNASMAWGVHSIYAVFGADDGFRVLRPLIYNATRPPIEVYAGSPRTASQALLQVVVDHLVHWRLYIGLPLVGPILILSRSTLADGVLPVLPIIFFVSQAHSPDDTLDFAQWPPSASFAFAMLPYVRGLYNFYYKKVWAEKEKQWLQEIQPRSGQNQDEAAAAGANGNAPQDQQEDENVFEVRIDGGIWDDWEDDDRLVQDAAANQAQRQEQQEDEGAPAPEVQNNRPMPQGGANEQAAAIQQQGQQGEPPQIQPQAQQPGQQAGAERRLTFSPTAIAETVLGAILFPTIAGLTGEALKLVMPKSWTTPPPPSPRFNTKMIPKGFFQHKWARSLVGGCLFVVCKDALMLYVRWKMAQMHRGRRVVDFDRRKGQGRKAAT